MKNQDIELAENLFTIEAEERLETVQIATEVTEPCCDITVEIHTT